MLFSSFISVKVGSSAASLNTDDERIIAASTTLEIVSLAASVVFDESASSHLPDVVVDNVLVARETVFCNNESTKNEDLGFCHDACFGNGSSAPSLSFDASNLDKYRQPEISLICECCCAVRETARLVDEDDNQRLGLTNSADVDDITTNSAVDKSDKCMR